MTRIEDSYKDALVHEGDILLIANVSWNVVKLENDSATVQTVDPYSGKTRTELVPISALQKHKEGVVRFLDDGPKLN